jgi:hypothetical protein
MGATVTTGKKAHAFLSNEGAPIFILEEQTYEKNVFPPTPKWSVIAFGAYQDVMRHVFRYASATEGGMLQGRSGCIGSEGYIKGLRIPAQRDRPFQQYDRSFQIDRDR